MKLKLPRFLFSGFVVALAIALIALGAWRFWRGNVSDAVVARYAPLVRTLQFSARVAALSRVDVGSTITGRVARVLVREGDQVKARQTLVVLEPEEFRAALAQAEAAERQAEARLAGLRSTGRSAARAQLDQAEATLRNARTDLTRQQQLVQQGFVSPSKLDDAQRAVAVAEAQRDAAQAQLQANAENGTDIVQAIAQLGSARAATAAARVRLEQTVIVAPTAARVLVRDVEPGQIVQPGRALIGLALAGPTLIKAQVDERFLEQLRAGQKAAVVADAFPDQRLAATVQSILPQVDAQRAAVEVRLTLDQPPPAFLREDMTLSVEVETGRRERALVLPARALRAGEGGGDAVFVAQDGRAVQRPVRLGLRTLDAVEIVDGVKEGEPVLLAPTLKPGARVRPHIVDWRPPRTANLRGGAPEDAGQGLTQAIGR